MKRSMVIWLMLIVMFATASILRGQGDPRLPFMDPDGQTLFLGLGAYSSCSEYKGVDTEIYAVPLVLFKNDKFYWYGYGGGYRIWENDVFSIAPEVSLRLNGYDADDSDVFRGMDDRDPGIDAGLSISATTDWGMLRLSAMSDILGKTKGQTVRLSYFTAFNPTEKLTVIPMLGVLWQNTQTTDYYYGVRLNEDNTDDGGSRPAYRADDTTNLFAGVNAVYHLKDQWYLYGMVYYEWLGSEITDSPLVDQDFDINSILGIAYRF